MATLPDSLKKGMTLLDVHTHVGVDPKLYLGHSLPFCRSIDVSRAEATAVGISHSACFPWVTSLYYDLQELARTGNVVISGNGVGDAPYHFENEQMLRQLYETFPEYVSGFIPFVIVDTLRETRKQVEILSVLLEKYPFYGIKIHPRDAQAHIMTLDAEGAPILEFARKHDFPILIHGAATDIDPLSQVNDILELATRHPDLRWCPAHFCGFNEALFDRADKMNNVWVDSAAMSIGCDTVLEGMAIYETGPAKIDADYSRPEDVFRALAERFPDSFMFGTDNPAHTWIDTTTYASGETVRFALRSSMEREKNMLSLISGETLEKVSYRNALAFIEG